MILLIINDDIKSMRMIFEKVFTGFILLSIISMFIGSILSTYMIIDLLSYSYILYIILTFAACFYISNFIICKNKFEICDALIILLIILGLVSVIFSGDIGTSLIGCIARNEGFYSILSYYFLFLISTFIKNDKYKKVIINTILIMGVISTLYGLLQVTDLVNKISFIKIMGKHCHAKGFVGNANSFGAQSLMYLCLSIGLAFKSKKKIPYIILCIIFSIAVFISGTMSAILTLAIILIIMFIYILIIKKGYKNPKRLSKYTVIILICIICSYFFVSSFSKKNLFKDINEMGTQIVDVLHGKINDSYGTGRIFIWKNALRVSPKYLLHGVGIDRFAYAFGDSPLILPDTGNYVDKAHNEYLQILITEGIFTLITYLILLFTIIKNGFKNINKNEITAALLLCVLAYIIQAFFNISVTRVAPYFFIFMGLLYTREKDIN